jgi:hypothetical protein
MSQRDVLAELHEARVAAPSEVRERVRLIAAAAPAPPRRGLTWRRALIVALPVAAAVAATVVLTRPSHQTPHGKAVAESAVAQPPTMRAVPSFGPATTPSRVQVVGTTLSLRIPTAAGVSDAIKRAVAIATSLSGYAASVHASTHGKTATADLVLKVPRTHVQQAVARLSQLGTITAEQVSVTDKTADLSATDREIARLQKQLAAARAASPPNPKLVLALETHIQRLQRSEAQTRLRAHYATITLRLATPPVPAKAQSHGPLRGVVVALRWLGIGAVYALALGLPVAIVVALIWLALRFVRRRREDSLLSR